MIVVDTDVLVYLVVRDDTERSALADRVRIRDRDWRAPRQWVAEFRNVLATHMHHRDLELEDALQLMDAATQVMRGGNVEVTSTAVLTLAERSKCTAYDSEFAAAALVAGVPLVTGDRRLARAFPGLATTMEEFAAG